jgi:hypothetical protein
VDIDFMGPVNMTISVTGCILMVAGTHANYQAQDGDHASIINVDYAQIIDGVTCDDPFTNVRINGVPITRGISALDPDGTLVTLLGQWCWRVGSGCLFEATLNVEPGWL